MRIARVPDMGFVVFFEQLYCCTGYKREGMERVCAYGVPSIALLIHLHVFLFFTLAVVSFLIPSKVTGDSLAFFVLCSAT